MAILKAISNLLLGLLWFLIKLVGSFIALGIMLALFVTMCLAVTALMFSIADRDSRGIFKK